MKKHFRIREQIVYDLRSEKRNEEQTWAHTEVWAHSSGHVNVDPQNISSNSL